MDILITLLKVLLLFVCVLLVFVVLMQRPKQEGLGAAFGGGITDSLLGAGTTSFLQKATVYMAVFFFVSSTALAVLVAKKQRGDDAVALKLAAEPTPDAVAPPVGGTGLPGDPLGMPDLAIPSEGSDLGPGELDVDSLVPSDAEGMGTVPAPDEVEQPADGEPAPSAVDTDGGGGEGADSTGEGAAGEGDNDVNSNPSGN